MLSLTESLKSEPKTIVIVDDTLDLTCAYQQILELKGYRVFLAASGPEALELLSRIPSPNLLLVDFLMPIMNGVDFLKELKKQNPEIFEITPIVGFSGLFSGSPLLIEMELMVCRVVEKPSGIEEVLRLVNETIR